MAEDPVKDPSWLYRSIEMLKGCNWTTLTEKEVPRKDMRGKWVIITGANNGIGFEAAKTLAEWGANLVLGCREPPAWETHPTVAAEQIIEAAKAAGQESSIEWWPIDMADFDTVDAFAERWNSTGRALDVLCNNAGMAPHSTNEQSATKDGIQILHQVNTVSHILLTYRLLDSLAQSPEPRIVCTTSCHQFRGFFKPETMNDCTVRPVHLRGDIYANNKLYLQTWVAEMHRRLTLSPKYKHITINGINPGYVNSGLWTFSSENRASSEGRQMEWVLGFFASRFAISPFQGSLAIVYTASSGEFGPDLDVQGVGEKGARGGGNYINRIWRAVPMPYVEHEGSRVRLWNMLNEEVRGAREGVHVLDELDRVGGSVRQSRL